jgi:hypothetical protein
MTRKPDRAASPTSQTEYIDEQARANPPGNADADAIRTTPAKTTTRISDIAPPRPQQESVI